MKIGLTLGGSYPRTEELVKATWNFDKGLLPQEELSRLQSAQAQQLLALQERFGFSPLSDGLLTWQDLFRPLVATSPSFEVGGVTRLFETNRFFRQPILHQPPQLDWPKLEAYFPHAHLAGQGPWKAILPSPYGFTHAVKDHAFHDEYKLGHALAGYLNEVARRLDGLGYQAIQFNEAQLFYESKPDVGLANELLVAAVNGVRAETVANFLNGNAAPHAAFLQTVPVSTIGIDFVETLPEKLPARLQGKQVLAQVVNAQESLLEAPGEVRELVGRIQDRLKPARLTATHTWDLEFVPPEVAVQKLEVLASLRAARTVTA